MKKKARVKVTGIERKITVIGISHIIAILEEYGLPESVILHRENEKDPGMHCTEDAVTLRLICSEGLESIGEINKWINSIKFFYNVAIKMSLTNKDKNIVFVDFSEA